jgi:leucyl-tRNA synthetase
MRRGWWPVPASQIPAALRERCRINPDTMACPFWSWDTHHVPLPLYSSDTPSGLGDIVMKWLEGKPPKKIIYVKNKMINVVLG